MRRWTRLGGHNVWSGTSEMRAVTTGVLTPIAVEARRVDVVAQSHAATAVSV